ncbi:uncharacterized protein LOC107265348 [Cephus cinctus]|uniref:Uncharacterized protein LOC107265348 n=1 Tax=Cephus cinctus TaxID=211228 RepID=A0AAJ7RDF9_CEPCN|nr:uncharacterized protein LOC107265348 [Cephus cinctus]XP_015590219.1 uncharacterized protein LOC107265348 [Cephus cinctus]XP_015590220.1 uncharacterized protein LOC107265348 [Cephus cinctus]XP_024938430.1 uncharacterized protein LOC107265348 [Cephus cinctus]XP_024938432.1 uncharacterized protein LOC107265348 [Cephus cinctus]
MNSAQAENILATLYSSSAALCIISIISLVVPWQHWDRTFNSCINLDCGCVLYGINTFGSFMGGDGKVCHFATYALVPSLLIGVCLGAYHGYRSCFTRSMDEPRTISRSPSYYNRNNLEGEVVVIRPKQRSPCKQWMPVACLAALICCLSLAHAVVITDGYYKTCEQYRRYLVNKLRSGVLETQAIHNRLSCGAILDFMDYIHPDTNNWRRGDEINTGLALQFSITTSWFNLFVWVGIFVISTIMARRRNKSLGEKLCCCCC